jgi:hypothetical protein
MQIDFGHGKSVRATRLAVTIPDTDRDGRPVADAERWVGEARRLFTRLFGGCTCHVGLGMWHAWARGVFIEETSTVVAAYVEIDDVRAHLATLSAFIAAFRTGANQEAVAVEFAGALYFVTEPVEARIVA